jgi:hypothetical protein
MNVALNLLLEEGSFQEYMTALESTVLEAVVSSGTAGKRDTLPVRPGKLSRTSFGKRVGTTFESSVSFAIDYYGMLKRSTALLQEIQWVRDQLSGRQVKTVESLVIHFASIRIEHVARFNPHLIAGFPIFKKSILESRGFKPQF